MGSQLAHACSNSRTSGPWVSQGFVRNQPIRSSRSPSSIVSSASAYLSVVPNQCVGGHLANVRDRVGSELALHHVEVARVGEVRLEGTIAEAQNLGRRQVVRRQGQRVDGVL